LSGRTNQRIWIEDKEKRVCMLLREMKLLELLAKDDRVYTTVELAKMLHVSTKTIKKDIKNIKEELKTPECHLHSQAGKGVWLTCSDQGNVFIKSLLSDIRPICSDAPENRKYHVLLKLLQAPSYLSMESIADTLYVSKGTVVNDVNEIIPFVEKQGLTMEKKAKYGVRVLGKESRIRIAECAVISKLVRLQGNGLLTKLVPFFEETDLQEIHTILHDMEDDYGFTFADSSYAEMMISLAITVERVRNGNVCCPTEGELNGYRQKNQWSMAGHMARKLEQEFHIVMDEGEQAYITMNLMGAKLQNRPMENKAVISGVRDIQKLDEIMKAAGDVFHEDILGDQLLRNTLYMHLEGMFNRLNHQMHLDNPIKQMVKDELAYEFEIATYIAGLIAEQFGTGLGDDEICDIALYLGASFERRKISDVLVAPTVVIACGTGMGTSLFFEARLKRVFPDITIRRVLPVSRIREVLEQETLDCVISTVPLALDGINVIQVSPVLNDKDIEVLRKALYPGKNEKMASSGNSYPNLWAMLNEKITILNCDCKTAEEVIVLLGQRMIQEKYVDSGFIESVLKREKLAPTSIGGMFAIPHAFEGHVIKQGIGLMTLRKPVIWGEERVQIILMLSVDVNSTSKLRIIFEELADLTKDTAVVRQILAAGRFSNLKL